MEEKKNNDVEKIKKEREREIQTQVRKDVTD